MRKSQIALAQERATELRQLVLKDKEFSSYYSAKWEKYVVEDAKKHLLYW